MEKQGNSATAQVSGLDRALIEDALDSLFRERMTAFKISSHVATQQGGCLPTVEDFGLPDILRLGRLMAGDGHCKFGSLADENG